MGYRVACASFYCHLVTVSVVDLHGVDQEIVCLSCPVGTSQQFVIVRKATTGQNDRLALEQLDVSFGIGGVYAAHNSPFVSHQPECRLAERKLDTKLFGKLVQGGRISRKAVARVDFEDVRHGNQPAALFHTTRETHPRINQPVIIVFRR